MPVIFDAIQFATYMYRENKFILNLSLVVILDRIIMF